jgi:tRNA G46 methylase TrmB
LRVKDIKQSGQVSSSQEGIHPQLEKYVRRHLASPWSQPLHGPTVQVFHNLKEHGVIEDDRPVILDSGCGTGHSTKRLAESNPDHLVIGVDQSLARLSKSGVDSGVLKRDNWVLARAELATFWRVLYGAGHVPQKHYLLYPNPWPKPGHLQRRWHAHPVFPWLLALGGEIELRCNWEIYALEFSAAVRIATGETVEVKRYRSAEGVSPFEIKYLERGHELYSVKVPAGLAQDVKPDT